MMRSIDASGMDFQELNELLRRTREDFEINGCLGQRFIGAGMGKRRLRIHGVPGNALGAYLNGGDIEVFGNAQDAVGDTMNAGTILVHGSIGDTAGYAMRGGKLYVRGSAGYRTGIHMKAYREHVPVIIIGGRAGSFLGEYQAGGILAVLGLHTDGKPIVSNFPCTGDARRQALPALEVRGRPVSGAGDAPSGHVGGHGGAGALPEGVLRSVQSGLCRGRGRALHGGDAGQRQSL